MEPHFSAASLYSCTLISQIESLMFRIWKPKQGSHRSICMPFGSLTSSLFAFRSPPVFSASQGAVRSSRRMPFGSLTSSLVAFRVLPVFSVSQGFALALPCSFSGSGNEPPSRAFFYQKPLFVENSSFHHPSVRVL